jgi:hypothetical protein
VSPHDNGDELIAPLSNHGRGTLTLINGTQYDAVVNMITDERVRRSIFISAGQTAILSHISQGTYEVRVAQGNAWSDDAHAFNEPAGYFAFPHPYTFEETAKDSGIEYDKISLTLHEVPDGNIIKVPITEAAFWPPGQ